MRCYYKTTACEIDITDFCVCDISLGGILVLCDGSIYRRIQISEPCSVIDFIAEVFVSDSSPFDIADDSFNSQTINSGDTITFNSINGIKDDITTNTITFDGTVTKGNIDPVFTPTPNNIIHFYVNTATNKLFVWSPVSGWQNTGNVSITNSLPFADFDLTYRGLRATANAINSSSTEDGVVLSYSWNVSPSSGVSLSNPVGVSTNIIFPNTGEYTITLTVTDSNFSSRVKSRVLRVDRILTVIGSQTDVNAFNTVSDALTWIRTNDVSNHMKYVINITGKTTESTSTIIPINCQNLSPLFFFKNNGQIINGHFNFTNIGETYTPNPLTYYIIAENNHIPITDVDLSLANPNATAMLFSDETNYVYMDNVFVESKRQISTGRDVLSIIPSLQSTHNYYFNCKFGGSFNGYRDTRAGTRISGFRDSRFYECLFEPTYGYGYYAANDSSSKLFFCIINAPDFGYSTTNVVNTLFGNYITAGLVNYSSSPITYPYGAVTIESQANAQTSVVVNNYIREMSNGATRNDLCAFGFRGIVTPEQLFVSHNYIKADFNTAIMRHNSSLAELYLSHNYAEGYFSITSYGSTIPSTGLSTSSAVNLRLFHNALKGIINATSYSFASATTLPNRNLNY
ncbi:MAG: PKD domain-containing protein [Spirochaetes bacterium]|nr:MAG: PKD domain-containing protein [Spirochaetota bacterium]